jgi:uncharacterized protein
VSEGETIVWHRLDLPGHDTATIIPTADGWRVTGVAVLVESERPCRVDYDVICDARWFTRSCSLRGYVGATPVELDIERSSAGSWTVAGAKATALRDCEDIDLGFSPATNLLPIRRLALPVGVTAPVRAAWVRFPEFTTEVLEQSYTRLAADRYRYESAGGSFHRELQVDPFGCVLDYPGLWRASAVAPRG